MKPQIAQVATPVAGSISRKLGHPLVPQKRREPVEATAAVRRRIRRMELERPARVVVAERDIMVWILVLLSGAPQVVWAWAAADRIVAALWTTRDRGRNGLVVRRAMPGASVGSRRSTGAVAADR